ncbi:S4 domain-containing protein [Vreelandella populi]|uniref:Tyrosine--tRNA ligase SYY-like C-terminal domain-containing protein n=1 Tax=Vreelandella populi TaxID=2498858 RepID=A0A3S0YEC3_9GAMM|nr:hypothetical protein ELY25_15850 [Halomonas populi]RUR48028.1 hypothetical protein ELY37_05205 [Halomonas populi]RUR54727.1 hypothetical protein ELY40_09205 [Halomonas populi]
MAWDGLPCVEVSPEDEIDTVLVRGKFVGSKRQARELFEQGAVHLNGEHDQLSYLGKSFVLFDTYWVVQKGK